MTRAWGTIVVLAALACDPAGPHASPASTTPVLSASASPVGLPVHIATPDNAPLSQLCPTAKPCPTLAEHLAALRAKDCAGSPPNSFKSMTCGAYTLVESDYGIVGYWHYFGASGVLVGAIAHSYEHGGGQIYGAVPTCTPGPPSSVCGATPSPSARPK
jgi:hypothetical protein